MEKQAIELLISFMAFYSPPLFFGVLFDQTTPSTLLLFIWMTVCETDMYVSRGEGNGKKARNFLYTPPSSTKITQKVIFQRRGINFQTHSAPNGASIFQFLREVCYRKLLLKYHTAFCMRRLHYSCRGSDILNLFVEMDKLIIPKDGNTMLISPKRDYFRSQTH